MQTALERGILPGVDGYLIKWMTYDQCYSLIGAIDCAFATFVPGKGGIVERKWAEVAATTVPPAVAPTAKRVRQAGPS